MTTNALLAKASYMAKCRFKGGILDSESFIVGATTLQRKVTNTVIGRIRGHFLQSTTLQNTETLCSMVK